jgi:hypothetical protein
MRIVFLHLCLGGLLAAQAVSRGVDQKSDPLPAFIDVTAESKVVFVNHAAHTSQKYLIESMGAGVAMLDYDNDGLLDLFFVNAAATSDPMPAGKLPDKSKPQFWNRLYHNNGDGTFTDVTQKAGVTGDCYGMGVATGDYDNDGFTDIYVTNFGRNVLYHNNGDGTFTDVTQKAGVAGGGWSTSAAFVDYDRDGRLDLIVARYMDWDFSKNIWCGDRAQNRRSYCHPDEFKPLSPLIFHNNGDGTFTDVTAKTGLALYPGKGLGVAINDFDLDGWPDIVIANDAAPQQVFHNRGNGTFEEVGLSIGASLNEDGRTFSGMGVDIADYDNDGWPDIVISDLFNQRYMLFRNVKGEFQDFTTRSRVGTITQPHSGWGLKFIDYDNDGWKDLFVAQGHVMDDIEVAQPGARYLEPPLLMRNVGGVFTDVSLQSGPSLSIPIAGRGAAFGDFNNDGFVDVVINCNHGGAILLKNTGNANHWLMVNTIGTVSNRDGIGARLHVVSDSGREQYAFVGTSGSYLSANDKRAHFGLGHDKIVRLLDIIWPSGINQKLTNISADQIITVREPRSRNVSP